MTNITALKSREENSVHGWTSTLILTVIVFLIADLLLKIANRKISRLPPGPFVFPLIGNLPQLYGHDLHERLTSLGHQFGSLVWLKLGGENVLVVNNMTAAVNSFVRQGKVFSGRPKKRKTVDVLLGKGRDIIMSDVGPELKFHRKLVHSFLAAQTKSGKSRLEDILLLESHSLCEKLEEYCQRGEPFNPKMEISRVVANVLSTCVLSRRFPEASGEFKDQLDIVQDIVDNIESFNIVDIFPFLEHFPIPSWRRFLRSLKRRDDWLNDVIKEHKETITEEDRDFLDALLKSQRESEENEKLLSDETIGHIVHELFGGGIESTTMTLLWFIIYMVRNPQWQSRIRKELRENTDETGLPRPFDKGHYPVLDATIKETLRKASVLPVGFPHRTMQNTEVNGYFVPKDTMVLMNIWSIHHDEKSWVDPEKFNPGRFLGETSGERYSYLPFGIGNRVCLGSVISKMEIFMYAACLVSKYEIVIPETDPFPDLNGVSGLTRRPKPFKILLKKCE